MDIVVLVVTHFHPNSMEHKMETKGNGYLVNRIETNTYVLLE